MFVEDIQRWQCTSVAFVPVRLSVCGLIGMYGRSYTTRDRIRSVIMLDRGGDRENDAYMLNAEGYTRRDQSEIHVVDAPSISRGGRRWSPSDGGR